MSISLKIFDPNPQKLFKIENALNEFKNISYQHVDKMLYLHPPQGLDVLYLPLAAAEKFGSKPLIHKSQILSVPLESQRDGLPPYIVTGTCLDKNNLRGPIPEITLLLSCVFEAIRTFNLLNSKKLEKIGFWADNLLPGITPDQLRTVLIEIASELK